MSIIESHISVIIPTFNRAAILPRAVDSVLAQTVAPQELIVVDDGSTDSTQDVLASYISQIKVITQSNKGVSAARNTGINHAKGDWFALLDSDDEWKPSKLERQIDYIEHNPSCKILQTQENWIRHGLWANPKNKHNKPSGWIFQNCLKMCVVSPSAVIIHREVFEKVGFFDETLLACEDYDLWLRIALHYPIDLLDESLIVKYGGHDDQLSRAIWGLDRFRIQALDKLLDNPAVNPNQTELVRNELKRKMTVLLTGARKRNKQKLVRLCQARLTDLNNITQT